jgi:type IX secretion system PorP/SprF family membrane protein
LLKPFRDISGFLFSILISIMSSIFSLHAQDPFLSQYYSNTVYLNPAFAGSSGMTRFTLGYRNQFPSLGSVYVIYHAAFDMPVELVHGGVGLNIMNDVQGGGQLNNLRIDGMYSHIIMINQKIEVIGGLQASYVIRSLKTDDLTFPDGMNYVSGMYVYTGPGEPISDQTSGYPDFAAGALCFSRNWYAGIAVHHLTAPNMSFSKNYKEPLPRKFTFHGGINIPVFEKRFGREFLQVNPNLVYIQQGSQRQVNLGAEVIRKGFFAGVWGRFNMSFGISSITAVAGYQNRQMRFGYSFDFNMSQPWVTDPGTGAHEIGFTYRFEKSDKKTKLGTINCPKI